MTATIGADEVVIEVRSVVLQQFLAGVRPKVLALLRLLLPICFMHDQ